MSAPPQLKAGFDPLGTRRDEKNLLRLADAPDPRTVQPATPFQLTPEQRAEGVLLAKKYQFFTDEGAALLVEPRRKGHGGAVFVQGAVVPQPFVENPFRAPQPGAPRRRSPLAGDSPRIVPPVV